MSSFIMPIPKDIKNNLDEAKRYLGYKKQIISDEVEQLISDCNDELLSVVQAKCCYLLCDLEIDGANVKVGQYQVESSKLAKNLRDCKQAYIFVATIGQGLDRLVNRYNRLQPSKAVIIDALGSAYVEEVCDYICYQFEVMTNSNTKPRFSPGYGDLKLATNRQLLAILDTSRKIGVSIDEGDLMFPVKSVSAIVGISEKEKLSEQKCTNCSSECEYSMEVDDDGR